jgi:hypothetical protein
MHVLFMSKEFRRHADLIEVLEPVHALRLSRQQQVDASSALEVHGKTLFIANGDLRLQRRAVNDLCADSMMLLVPYLRTTD